MSRYQDVRQLQPAAAAPAPASGTAVSGGTAAEALPTTSAAAVSSSAAGACAFCSKAAGSRSLKACPCGLTSYCDKTCQMAHFPAHRATCKEARRRLQGAKQQQAAPGTVA